MYLYGLGLCDASRSESPCSHLKTVSIDPKKNKLVSMVECGRKRHIT